MKLKKKYLIGGRLRNGTYKGRIGKRTKFRVKLSDTAKRALPPQPKMAMPVGPTGKRKMVRYDSIQF